MNLTLITHLIAAAVAAAAAWFYQGAQMDATVAKLNATHAAQESERRRIALDDARATFHKGEIHARNQQEIADAHAAQEKRRLARLATAAADGERLRKQVTEYAATCGGGEADSPADALQHCRDRAATLGVLYGEADSQAEAFAGAAEQHADEVRTLMRIIQNDRTLLPPPGGLGLKAPPRPVAGQHPEKTMINSEYRQPTRREELERELVHGADIEANIATEAYFTAHEGIEGARAAHGKYQLVRHNENEAEGPMMRLTFCVLILDNGFTVTGESACAIPENFNAEIGRRIARENAVNKIWPLLGFRLRDELARPVLTDADAAADLAGTPRPDNPTAEAADFLASVKACDLSGDAPCEACQ